MYEYDDFFVVSFKAVKGQFGCQLWFSKELPIAKISERQIYFKFSDFHIIHSDPRKLVVMVKSEAVRFVASSLHAPHTATTESKKELFVWWPETKAIFAPHRGTPQVIFIDKNLEVPTGVLPGYGDLRSKKPQKLFHHCAQVVKDCGWWAPSTFSEFVFDCDDRDTFVKGERPIL